MNESKSKLIPACGLWIKTSAAGRSYMVGRLGGLRFMVMENRDKQIDADPTHMLLIGAAPPRNERGER